MPTKTVKTDDTNKIFENKKHDKRIHICYNQDATRSPITEDDVIKIAFIRIHNRFQSPNHPHIPSFVELNRYLVKNASQEIQNQMEVILNDIETDEQIWLKKVIDTLKKAGIIAFTVERHLHGNVHHYTQSTPKLPTKEQFDVSFAGLIYIKEADLEVLLGRPCDNLNQNDLDEIQTKMNQTLELHDQYLNGEIYDILISNCQETEFNACTEFYGIDTSIESFKDMKNEPYWEFIEDELPKEALNPEDWTEI